MVSEAFRVGIITAIFTVSFLWAVAQEQGQDDAKKQNIAKRQNANPHLALLGLTFALNTFVGQNSSHLLADGPSMAEYAMNITRTMPLFAGMAGYR